MLVKPLVINVGLAVVCSLAGLLLLLDVMPISYSDTNRSRMDDTFVSVFLSFLGWLLL